MNHLICLSFILVIIASSRAEETPTSTVSSSSYQTTEPSKSTLNLTSTTATASNATGTSPSNIVEDIGKMINSFATIAPVPFDIFGKPLQPGQPLPTIDINKILKSLPNIPPIQIPNIDPSFLANLPTLPPLVLPTLDPDFFKNLPTLGPLPTLDPDFFKNLPTLGPFPTLDPDFFKNLPTIAPIQIPTLDPDFFKNLPTLGPLPTLDPDFFKNLPTISPIKLPTLDPDFWKNIPTLPPLPTLSLNNGWPTLPPFKLPDSNTEERCIPKLLKSARENQTFYQDLEALAQQGEATNAVLRAVEESKNVCNEDQSSKLASFVEKHMDTFQFMDKFSTNFSEKERLKVFQLLITENSMALKSFSAEKGLQNIFNPSYGVEMMNLSLRVSGMQMELVWQPI